MKAARAIGFVFLAALGGAQTHAQPGETANAPEVPPPRRARFPYPPISVAAPMIEVPRSISSPQPAQPAPPVQVPRPTAISNCDAGGCWDADGRRLNIVGPMLVGPGGACAAQAGVVHCP